MKVFLAKQIIVLAAAIAGFAAWTPAASDNSTVHIVLTAILTCDDSGPGSVINNGHRLQGQSPCQASASLPADRSSGPGINATSVSTPDGSLLLAFERGEIEVIIVVMCPAN